MARRASTIRATPSSTPMSVSISWRQFSSIPLANVLEMRGRSATTCGLSYMLRSLKFGLRGMGTPA